MRKFILAALVFIFFTVRGPAQTVPKPGMKITAVTVLKPGTYQRSETTGDFLAVSGENYTLDLTAFALSGREKAAASACISRTPAISRLKTRR